MESGLTPARTLLDHRQAQFAQRLHARPLDWGGPEEILDQEGVTITTWLRAAAGTRRGEMVEPQVWSEGRAFPGECYIDKEGPALETTHSWRTRMPSGPTDPGWTMAG